MMSTHEDADAMMPSPDEIQDMMVAKAHELFAVCDKEEKVRSYQCPLRFSFPCMQCEVSRN